jgi:hypothetical protein
MTHTYINHKVNVHTREEIAESLLYSVDGPVSSQKLKEWCKWFLAIPKDRFGSLLYPVNGTVSIQIVPE